jgi:hypothetical protein
MAVYVYDVSAAELARVEGGGWDVTSHPTETITLNFTQIKH